MIIDSDPTYNADHHGFLILVEEGDQDAPLTEIGWDEYRLATLPYEGITKQRGQGQILYIAIVLANNDYGLVFVIPEHLVSGELEKVINENLDPPINQQTEGDQQNDKRGAAQ
jgi:hypothetical protein